MSRLAKYSIDRRQLLLGSGVAALAMGSAKLLAQGAARWRRYNVASAQGQQMLASYQIAIGKMLKLPPTDPRNWYRVAFTHFLDCPHGNWWLFPWHRGFTGWVERIVRELSGNPAFAFPYWDWTVDPAVPAAMSQGVLTPANASFIRDVTTFANQFRTALDQTDYFTSGSCRYQQLKLRGINSGAELWDQITDSNSPDYPSFFPALNLPNVRNPSPQLDCEAKKAVATATIDTAMAAMAYTVNPAQPIQANFFSSPQAPYHSKVVGFAILEGQPHNKVHNNTGGVVYPTLPNGQCGTTPTDKGGFMQAFLSPVDPLFFLHHANIDRLWTVWTQRQVAAGRPALPTGDLAAWSNEPFLFFCDEKGTPLVAKAGDYADIGAFDYDYQPASSDPAPTTSAAAPSVRLTAQAGSAGTAATEANVVTVGSTLADLAASVAGETATVTLTLDLPHRPRGQVFPVQIDAGNGVVVDVGTVALFGHGMAHGPLSFTLPVGTALRELGRRGALKSGNTLRFNASAPAVAGRPGTMAMPAVAVPVSAVAIAGG